MIYLQCERPVAMKKESIQTRNRKTNNKVKKSNHKADNLHPKLEHSHTIQPLALASGNADANCTLDFSGMGPFLNNANFFGMPANLNPQANDYTEILPCHYSQSHNPHYIQ